MSEAPRPTLSLTMELRQPAPLAGLVVFANAGIPVRIRDTEQAWPDYYYLIVSCMDGVVKEGKAFYRTSWDTREMLEEPVEVVPGSH